MRIVEFDIQISEMPLEFLLDEAIEAMIELNKIWDDILQGK